MALTFNGGTLFGTHGPARFPNGAPTLQTLRRKFAGVIGESEHILERGGRAIEYEAILHRSTYTNATDVVAVLEATDAIIGTHGTLAETGTITRTFLNCTFEGFTPDPIGILRDFGQTIESSAVTWFVRGIYRFYQLKDV